MILTHQQTVEKNIAESNSKTLASVAPKAFAALEKKKAEAEQAVLDAMAEQDGKITAVLAIETHLKKQNEIAVRIEMLSNLASLDEAREANATIALNYFCEAGGNDPSAFARWVSATDQIQRAAICSPYIPSIVAGLRKESSDITKQIAKIAETNGFELSKVVEAIRTRRSNEPIVVTVLQ